MTLGGPARTRAARRVLALTALAIAVTACQGLAGLVAPERPSEAPGDADAPAVQASAPDGDLRTRCSQSPNARCYCTDLQREPDTGKPVIDCIDFDEDELAATGATGLARAPLRFGVATTALSTTHPLSPPNAFEVSFPPQDHASVASAGQVTVPVDPLDVSISFSVQPALVDGGLPDTMRSAEERDAEPDAPASYPMLVALLELEDNKGAAVAIGYDKGKYVASRVASIGLPNVEQITSEVKPIPGDAVADYTTLVLRVSRGVCPDETSEGGASDVTFHAAVYAPSTNASDPGGVANFLQCIPLPGLTDESRLHETRFSLGPLTRNPRAEVHVRYDNIVFRRRAAE